VSRAHVCVLLGAIRTVMKPHSKSGLKKFFPNIPDMAVCIGRGEREGLGGRGKRTERVLVEIRASCFEDEH
jgi:hypothetical protein